MILVDFDYDPANRQGKLDFSKAIPMDITGLLTEKKWKQLGVLIEEIMIENAIKLNSKNYKRVVKQYQSQTDRWTVLYL